MISLGRALSKQVDPHDHDFRRDPRQLWLPLHLPRQQASAAQGASPFLTAAPGLRRNAAAERRQSDG